MKPEINGGRKLRKKSNCSLSYMIHDNLTLVQFVTHIGFSDLLNANSCGFAVLLAECGAGCDLLRCFTDTQISTYKGWKSKRETRSIPVAAQGHQLQYDGLQPP